MHRLMPKSLRNDLCNLVRSTSVLEAMKQSVKKNWTTHLAIFRHCDHPGSGRSVFSDENEITLTSQLS